MQYYAGENLDRFDFRITKINRAELEDDRPKREKDVHRNIGSYQKIDVSIRNHASMYLLCRGWEIDVY